MEKGDALLQYIGINNECVNGILLDARTSREKIRIWSNDTLGSLEILEREHKSKRQALLIGGVASLFALGLTEWQINKINNRIADMQTDVSHNEENIQILGKAVKFNSKNLEAVEHNQMEIGDTLTKSAIQLNDSIHTNNNNSQKIACVQLKISYLNTARIVKEAVYEVKILLEFNLDKYLFDWS